MIQLRFSAMPSDDDILGNAGITLGQLKRAIRVYHQNADAAASLGITPRSLHRLCGQHGLETPYARRRREG